MRQFVRDAIHRKSELWMAAAMRELFDLAGTTSNSAAERFVIAEELSEQIVALDASQHGDCPKFVSYWPVAQYHYDRKNRSRG
ncbi:hypothetical protein [Bradyrhizobium japonicum]|uniref:hypothetical protein n=1 Tax=Bradyrhizobium japonicum TaxID=375 RepID=UPI0006943219|nr:hypothetical protein [Bradyrhizobium japonicum]